MTKRESATGTIKWFNATKGFGFITRDGQKDIFLHATVVAAAGMTPASPNELDGAEVSVWFREGPKGKGPVAERIERVAPPVPDYHYGVVSKYLPQKGFGFVTPEGHRRRECDVFIHKSVVEEVLGEGQTLVVGEMVKFTIGLDRNERRQVVSFEILPEEEAEVIDLESRRKAG
jgi:cold shock protein